MRNIMQCSLQEISLILWLSRKRDRGRRDCVDVYLMIDALTVDVLIDTRSWSLTLKGLFDMTMTGLRFQGWTNFTRHLFGRELFRLLQEEGKERIKWRFQILFHWIYMIDLGSRWLYCEASKSQIDLSRLRLGQLRGASIYLNKKWFVVVFTCYCDWCGQLNIFYITQKSSFVVELLKITSFISIMSHLRFLVL